MWGSSPRPLHWCQAWLGHGHSYERSCGIHCDSWTGWCQYHRPEPQAAMTGSLPDLHQDWGNGQDTTAQCAWPSGSEHGIDIQAEATIQWQRGQVEAENLWEVSSTKLVEEVSNLLVPVSLRQARLYDPRRSWLHQLLLVILVQIFWPEEKMGWEIARQLRTFKFQWEAWGLFRGVWIML